MEITTKRNFDRKLKGKRVIKDLKKCIITPTSKLSKKTISIKKYLIKYLFY